MTSARGYGFVWLSAALVLAACGMKPEQHYRTMRANLVSRNFEAANQQLDKSKEKIYSKDNRLLFYMDKGMVLHLSKKYQESNKFLEQAKQTAEDLWTESIGKNALAWFTTDNSLPYQGEDFEKVLIHFVAALNYIALKDYAAARVEARQITAKLELYNSKHEEGKSVYRDDAFARWLSGKLAETDGGRSGLNDAWIDYKKAITVYESDFAPRYQTPVPTLLVQDALRVLDGLGPEFADEHRRLRAKFPHVEAKTTKECEGLGEVVVLQLNGEAPHKIDQFWEARANNEPIRVAYPVFVRKPSRVARARVTVMGSGETAQSEVGADITAIAIQNLTDHMGRIQAKAIARAVTKYLAAKGMQAGGQALAKKNETAGGLLALAGAIYQVGSYVAEEADKRSWITLPSSVNVARVWVQPGSHQIELQLLAANGALVEKAILPVEVAAGETAFVSYRSFQ